MSRNRLIVYHPFLFVLFPILSLYTNNLGQEPFGDVVRSLAVGEAAAGLFLVLVYLVFKDWHRAGLVVTPALLAFFSFGSIAHLFGKTLSANLAWLWLGWAALLLVVEVWIHRRLSRTPRKRIAVVTRWLNLVGGLALFTCLYGFVAYDAHLIKTGPSPHVTDAPQVTGSPSLPPAPKPIPDQAPPIPLTGETPDIYYIILDGHARSDVLKELYGVDNTPFIHFLQSRGFKVGTQSHSNYDQTGLSLGSSFNYNYLDQVMEINPLSDDRRPLTYLINNSATVAFLKARGYQTVAFANGFPDTELNSADQFLQDTDALNGFELSLISQSMSGAGLSSAMIDNYRNRILWEEDQVEKQVTQPGPKLVFVHFILPHPPFVFRQDPAAIVSLDTADGSQFIGSRADYQAGYAEQVQYADVLAEKMIAYILDHSANPPVIVLQSDHGSGLDLDWTSQANTCVRERLSILNAYYLPDRYNVRGRNAARMVYPSITPVNSFRVILDAYFDADLPLLPDRSFYSTWAQPYDFSEVTGKFEKSCPVPRDPP